ncbi:MAG: hypothetical protein FWC95_00400 [Defluviitaleaceae bacterium]|nr:hypothetical protein [Defluviitaleaceae bacterium]
MYVVRAIFAVVIIATASILFSSCNRNDDRAFSVIRVNFDENFYQVFVNDGWSESYIGVQAKLDWKVQSDWRLVSVSHDANGMFIFVFEYGTDRNGGGPNRGADFIMVPM